MLSNFQRFYDFQKIIAIGLLFLISSFVYLSYSNIDENLKFSFLIFSTVSYFLLLISIFQSMSFGILSFGIMIFLGFFSKNVLHIINNSIYLEPISSFNYSMEQWKEVYSIASIAMFAISIAIVIASFYYKATKYTQKLNLSFYTQIFMLIVVIVMFIFMLDLNNNFGLLKLGIQNNAVQIPWILKIFIVFFIGVITPILLLIFLNENINNWKYFFILYIVFLGLAYYASVSINSRATIVAWTIPLLAAVYFEKLVVMKKLLLLIIFFVFTVFLSVGHVNNNRYAMNTQSKYIMSYSSVYRLLIDRWIGLEGLMSVVSYTDKGATPFILLTLNMRHHGELDFYTKNIALKYENDTTNKDAASKNFASLPGIIAYLYLSDSLIFLIFGLFIMINIIIFLERFVFQLTKNILLKYTVGFGLAFNFMSFGVDVIRAVRYEVTIIVFIFCLFCTFEF